MTSILLDCTPDAYHKLDGFSASLAHTLLTRSPLHAWQQHPLLGGGDGSEPTKSMDRGAVIHALVLGRGASFQVLPYDSYRTDKAKDARDTARGDGLIPILVEAFEDAGRAATAIMARLVEAGVKLDGFSEQAISWDERGVACRGMMDHLTDGCRQILDFKVSEDASPAAIERSAERYGYAIQAAAYTRAVEGLGPETLGRTRFAFIFAEPHPPYVINIVRPGGAFREIGRRRWVRACKMWGQCLKHKHWPGYESHELQVPGWAMAKEGEYDEE